MKILITNDDGINAEGIKELTLWAKKLGDVTVVAPKIEQSGKSHAIDFTHPLEIKRIDYIDGVEAWSLDSTPADCVRFGFVYLGGFDLVLSGINKGVNLGSDLVYSGTVGAIFEAARMGSLGIALSTYPDTLDEAKEHLDTVWSFITRHRLLSETPIYNVNIPKCPKGIKITKQGSPYFSDEFKLLEGDTFLQYGHMIPDIDPSDVHRDTNAMLNEFISITPLSTSRTDMRVFEKFKDI